MMINLMIIIYMMLLKMMIMIIIKILNINNKTKKVNKKRIIKKIKGETLTIYIYLINNSKFNKKCQKI